MSSVRQTVFLISSPLQSLACWLILNDEKISRSSKVVIFAEEGNVVPDIPGVKQVLIKNTRVNKKQHIRDNAKVVLSGIDVECDLWISDLLWPMNNVIYSNLLAKKNIKSVNFLDEGVVMYFDILRSRYYYAREVFKSLVFKFYFKHYSIPSRGMYSEIGTNGRIALFNPELNNRQLNNIEKISVRPELINSFFDNFAKKKHTDEIELMNCKERPILILSQPYYRVMKPEKFDEILDGLKRYLRVSEKSEVFIKLHPSESLEEYDRYYRRLGFRLVFDGLQSVPVEVVLSSLNSQVKVVSFGTSAFINARKFNFQGEMVVYGLEKITLESVPLQAELHIDMLTDLYKKCGCSMISFQS